MHLDMIAVNFFRLTQFCDTLFELATLYKASGWGICTPIIWLSIKIYSRMVENVTFPPEIYSLKSICIQFLVKIYNILCLITIFLLGHDFQIFAKVADFEEIFFRFKKYTVSNFFLCQYLGIELPA